MILWVLLSGFLGELEDLVRRLGRLVFFLLLAALFLGAMYGLVALWFELMNPYG